MLGDIAIVFLAAIAAAIIGSVSPNPNVTLTNLNNSGDLDVAWDAFYLYGSDAKWIEKPDRELATGTTVTDEFDTLKTALMPLLH